MKLHDVFRPLKKTDRVGAINLYPDLITVFFERREDDVKTEYVKVAHPSVVPNLRVVWRTDVSRILFYRPGMLLVPLAAGDVRLEPYPSNASEASKRLNVGFDSLSFTVAGYGDYIVTVTPGVLSGDFSLFGEGVADRYARGDASERWAAMSDKGVGSHYGNIQIAGFYPPVEKAVAV